jgi:hypothetical protein
VLLLAFLFAVQDEEAVSAAGGGVAAIFSQALTSGWATVVLGIAAVAFVLTLPALARVDIGGAPVPVAFFAVVSMAVVGLYLSFLIPIWLRLRAGARFTPGPWTLGRRYRWMAWVAVVEIVVISAYSLLPVTRAGLPWDSGFAPEFVNDAPIVLGGVLLALWVAWHASAKHWFTGPRTTIDPAEAVTAAGAGAPPASRPWGGRAERPTS